MNYYKNQIKKLINLLGWNLSKITILNSHELQVNYVIQLVKANIIFDIGANTGQFAQSVRKGGYKGQIVSFEPLSDAWIELKNNANNDSNWLIHERVAIGNSNGEIKINISNNKVGFP